MKSEFNVDKQFLEDFKKVFYQTLGIAGSATLLTYINCSIMDIENIMFKYVFCLFALYYWIFFVYSMNLIANKNKNFNVWYKKYCLLKKTQYAVLNIMLVLTTYQVYEAIKPDQGFLSLCLVFINYFILYMYMKFWNYLEENFFYKQWSDYINC